MNRLELMIRENRGRRERTEYTRVLTEILNLPIHVSDFIDLEITDKLIEDFYEKYKKISTSMKVVYSESDRDKLDNVLDVLGKSSIGEEGYLIGKQSEYCGAVKVPVDKSLTCYLQLIELDGDSLCICSKDVVKGVYIDYYEEYKDAVSHYFYELTVWGW